MHAQHDTADRDEAAAGRFQRDGLSNDPNRQYQLLGGLLVRKFMAEEERKLYEVLARSVQLVDSIRSIAKNQLSASSSIA